MHITIGRWFPKPCGSVKIFCPHEKCVRIGDQIQFTVMVGLFHIPLIPAAKVKEWRCTACGGAVVPNEGGKQFKNALLFTSIVALGGFGMFVLFAFLAYYVGGKNSMLDPGNLKNAKRMLAFFAFLGLCIVVKALFDARLLASNLAQIVVLNPEKTDLIDAALESGDDLRTIATKLTEKNFTDAEIRTYTESWCLPIS